MTKLAIIGDTAQDFTHELGKKFGVEVVSYYIEMDEKSYKDLYDIDAQRFYNVMDDHEKLSTGIPPIQEVLDLLVSLKEQGYEEVLFLACSHALTGMFGLYNTLTTMYDDMKIHIFDTTQIASASALLTIEAANMRDAGKSVEEILKRLEELKTKSKVFAVFRSLKYLVKGGRFNKYAGMIGSFLNINPILTMENGEIAMLDKVRGNKKSLVGLINYIKEYVSESKDYHIVVFEGDNKEEFEEFKEALKDVIDNANISIETKLTPVLGVHTGPKVVGASVLTLDK
ncbi:MAG: DegV family protein [Tissierellia bacterium]|nr:DegV family protein [Tissierellia bacterium]